MLYRSIYLSIACGFTMVHASESERKVVDKKEFDLVVAQLAQSKREFQSQAGLVALLHRLLEQREAEIQREAERVALVSRERDELIKELNRLRYDKDGKELGQISPTHGKHLP